MPFIVPPYYYRDLILRISEHPEGATRVQLGAEVTLPLEGRSLQRLLARLVDSGWIVRLGKARQAKYQLAPGRSIPASWREPLRLVNYSPSPERLRYTAAPSAASTTALPGPKPPPANPPSVPAQSQPAPVPAPTANPVRYQAVPAAAPSPRPSTVAPANKPAPSPAVAPVAPTPKPAPPPTRPMTPNEHAAWDDMLMILIPPMVKTGMKRHDAWMYADRVAGRMRPADAERFHAIVELELDTLTPETSAAYGITPEAYLAWHRKWQ